MPNLLTIDDENVSDEENIVQLDGINDLHPTMNQAASSKHTQRTFYTPSEAHSLKQASFKLNQKKQLSKLRQDALLTDFNITVSPTEQSVSVMCSTGFYTLVAVPSFSNIMVGSKTHIAGVTLFCNDITGKIDDVGANVNAVIHFRYSTPDQTSSGGIVVHMHHTARRVQVQGSSMVNRRVRANVWFVENFLLEQFTALSQNKTYDISKFNDAVTKMVTNHIDKLNAAEKCNVCSGLFNGRSIYEQCPLCSRSFHKKCSGDHACPAKTKTRYSQPSSQLTNTAKIPSDQTVSLNTAAVGQGRRPLLIPASTFSSTSPTISTTVDSSPIAIATSTLPALAVSAACSTTSLIPIMPTSIADPNNPVTDDEVIDPSDEQSNAQMVPYRLDPHSSPFIPRAGPSIEKGKGRGKNKTKPALATSSDGIDLEFARVEVNTIRAKLKDREKEVKDLEFQNSILLERLSVFEKAEKQLIYDRYFPKPSSLPTQPCSDPPPARIPACQSSCCRPRHYCCEPQPRCTAHDNLSSPQHDVLDAIRKSIEELRDDIIMVKTKLTAVEVAASDSKSKPQPVSEDILFVTRAATTGSVTEVPLDEEADDSINTIDENVMDLSAEESLNSNALTTRLLQLGH